jgi:hypothetical protein
MSGFCYRQGASEEEIERLEEAFFVRNRELFQELPGKGLLPPQGHNLPAHEITERLISGRGAAEDRQPRA